MTTPVDLLQDRVRKDPGRPLLTQYRAGARTELSAASFANWVDKTTNWFVDEDLSDLSAEEDAVVAIELAPEEPAHWVTFVWMFAAWQAGLALSPGHWPGAQVRVGGPDITAGQSAAVVISCSLKPFAEPGNPEPGTLDFSDEVRPQPDSRQAAPTDPARVAWLTSDRPLTLGELGADLDPATSVALVTGADDPLTAVRNGLIAPLLGATSAVLVSGHPSAEDLARIEHNEGIRRA